MRITTKLRNWKVGESSHTFAMPESFEQEIAKTITDMTARELAKAGETVVTISVEVNIGGTMLVKPLPNAQQAGGGE